MIQLRKYVEKTNAVYATYSNFIKKLTLWNIEKLLK